MKTEDISKLPPELTQFAENIRGLALKYLHVSTQIEVLRMYERDVEEIVNAALTWCLQVVEERDVFGQVAKQNMDAYVNEQECRAANQTNLGIALEKLETAEATIATLTRELENAKGAIKLIVGRRSDIPWPEVKESAVQSYMDDFAALSHTPEGKITT